MTVSRASLNSTIHPARGCSSPNRQTASAYAEMIHDNDALGNVRFSQCGKNFAHTRDYGGFAPVAIAKQNQARLGGLSEREQARVVEINGDDGSRLLLRPGHDRDIGCTRKPQVGGMHGIMPMVGEPRRQRRRQRHVDQESHLAGVAGCSSTVSSSARKAA